jgi:hypothetical protein
MQEALDVLWNWAEKQFHLDKRTVMHVGRNNPEYDEYHMNGTKNGSNGRRRKTWEFGLQNLKPALQCPKSATCTKGGSKPACQELPL